ncbi:MAG: metal-dependent hydrolase [Candidatus Heimdallarchaeota archaeon]
MTLGPTHIAVEAFVIWGFMGKKNREIFREKRWLFVLLSLFAILPDFDTLFYIHRTYMHSIVWPLFIILGVLIYYSVMRLRKEEVTEKADLISKSIIIASVFIMLHCFLDLNPGPVMLFYPFDNRLYRLSAVIVLDLDSVLLFKGFDFEWTSISFNEGIDNSLLNLTPAERIENFGYEFLGWWIYDFPIHVLVFLTYFIFFPGIAFVDWLKKYKKPEKFFTKLKGFKRPLLGLGLIVLTFGLTLGPAFKLNRTETRENTSYFTFSEDETNYGLAQSFELDKNDALQLHGDFAGNNSACSIASAIASEAQFNAINEDLNNLITQYNNDSNFEYSWLTGNYTLIVHNFVSNSLAYDYLTPNNTDYVIYTLPDKMKLYSIVILEDWNTSIDFDAEILVISTLHIKRPLEFYFGLAFAIIGSMITTIPIALTINEWRKKTKEEKIDDTDDHLEQEVLENQ